MLQDKVTMGQQHSSGVWLLWAVWGMSVGVGLGFNIETDHFVRHTGPPDSMFGFSLAQHRDTSGTWVVVGAPEAQTEQPEVVKGGAVYRCSPHQSGTCTVIDFDTTGDHWESGRQMDSKSNQWFGASVSSKSGVIVACAPRYVWFSVKKTRREPVGNCFISRDRDPQVYQMYSPCMTSAWGYHRQGSCQAGFGTALTQNGNRLYVGAVGSYYWQGQVFYQDLLNRQEALATDEGPQRDDMSYLGYSMASGDLTGDGEDDLAVGMPRGNDLMGQVVLLDHRLKLLYNITGDQVGSYFGYSVAVVDVDGDGLQDVAVGAPWYTHDPSQHTSGLVTLFSQTEQQNFQQSARLLGSSSGSHFGVSLASLEDLNMDGYGDLAVGAPYGGTSGKGAVYIYLGSPSGLAETPSQVLVPEELGQEWVSTFGWSLAGGLDLDHNEYPDLAVGAYLSNTAYVFRTRPVVQVDSNLRFGSENGIIDLGMQQCVLQDTTEVACVSLKFCLSYTGLGVPRNLQMDVSLRLDTKAELSPRMFFLHREQQTTHNFTIDLRKSVENCSSVYTYINGEPRDKLTPLVAEMVSGLVEEEGQGPAVLRPVLDPTPLDGHLRHLSRARIYIKNNCGADNVCVPDLSLHVNMEVLEYELGSQEKLVVAVDVHNAGEEAFQSKVQVRVPRGVLYNRFLLVQNTAPDDVTPLCSPLVKAEVEEVVCDVGNPLPALANITLHLEFQPNVLLINESTLVFHVTATSANEEADEDMDDNHVALVLPVTVRSDIEIRGISWPDEPFEYNATRFGVGLVGEDGVISHEAEVGPEVTHVYDVTNRGPSNLPAAQIFLLWPTRTLSEEPLLYLAHTPSVSPPAVCHSVPHVNYLNLEVQDSASSHMVMAPDLAAYVGSPSLRRAGEEDHVVEEQANHEHRRRRHSHHHRLHHHRRRRSSLWEEMEQELSCGPTNCTRVVCSVSPLRANDNVVVRVRSRLWVDTIEKLSMSEVKISSRLVVVGTAATGGDWQEGVRGELGQVWSATVTTVVRTSPEEPQTSLKWMVMVGSVLAGLLLLALLITILWAVGFFERKRPHDKTETEPLNTNGYYGNGKS